MEFDSKKNSFENQDPNYAASQNRESIGNRVDRNSAEKMLSSLNELKSLAHSLTINQAVTHASVQTILQNTELSQKHYENATAVLAKKHLAAKWRSNV